MNSYVNKLCRGFSDLSLPPPFIDMQIIMIDLINMQINLIDMQI